MIRASHYRKTKSCTCPCRARCTPTARNLKRYVVRSTMPPPHTSLLDTESSPRHLLDHTKNIARDSFRFVFALPHTGFRPEHRTVQIRIQVHVSTVYFLCTVRPAHISHERHTALHCNYHTPLFTLVHSALGWYRPSVGVPETFGG